MKVATPNELITVFVSEVDMRRLPNADMKFITVSIVRRKRSDLMKSKAKVKQ